MPSEEQRTAVAATAAKLGEMPYRRVLVHVAQPEIEARAALRSDPLHYDLVLNVDVA